MDVLRVCVTCGYGCVGLLVELLSCEKVWVLLILFYYMGTLWKVFGCYSFGLIVF